MKIWKYKFPLTDFILQLPKGTKILDALMQGEYPCLWALLDPNADKEERRFIVMGTGQTFPKLELKLTHISTFLENGYVWHLFEVVEK